jgi:hypothetical protein
MPEVNPWPTVKRLHRDRSPGKKAISEVWPAAREALALAQEPALGLERAPVTVQAPAISEAREQAGALPAAASAVVTVSATVASEVALHAEIVAALEADPEVTAARLHARAAVVVREVLAGLAVAVADLAAAADAEAVVVVEGGNRESHDKHQMDGGWAVVSAIARRLPAGCCCGRECTKSIFHATGRGRRAHRRC